MVAISILQSGEKRRCVKNDVDVVAAGADVQPDVEDFFFFFNYYDCNGKVVRDFGTRCRGILPLPARCDALLQLSEDFCAFKPGITLGGGAPPSGL